ncbi:MAG: lipid-A-disaccharide synthase [Rhodospirillales bacterium]|nr:lipid-A-disaccharide synthase [Rhodospirillales bacterium]
MTAAPLVFLIAGEPSGDVLGGRLMAALDRLTGGHIRFAGVGGPEMEALGLSSLFPMGDLSVMGVAEVVPRLPRILRRLRQTVAAAKLSRPAAVVTIDSPDFSFRVARRLKGRGFPLIHYVAPTVWAWRPGRARAIAAFLDHVMALLPFEPPYFQAEGLASTFVGHPVVESGAGDGNGAAFRRRHGIDPGVPLVCFLPGSRKSEVGPLMPIFGETLARLRRGQPDLRCVVATVATVADGVTAATRNWPTPPLVVSDTAEKYDAFAAADAALAASGTVALELAMANTPAVIAYKINPLTAFVVRRLVKVRYVNLINIVLDRPAVPEFLQNDCRPERLAAAIDDLLGDGEARDRQIVAGRDALRRLGLGGPPTGERAARVVLDVIKRYSESNGG